MEIKNINDEVRDEISNYYMKKENTLSENELYIEMERFLNKIKNSSNYRYIMGLIYVTAYIYTYKCKNVEEFYSYDFDVLESFSSLDDFIDFIGNEDFNILLSYILEFSSCYFSTKKEMISSTDNKDKLIEFFPSFSIDLMYYLNTYDKHIIQKDLNDILLRSTDDEDVKEKTVLHSCEKIINLENENHYNYKYLLLEILEDYYKYNLYLSKEKMKTDDTTLNVINMIENEPDFLVEIAYKNPTILRRIISDFLDYELSSKNDINTFYDDNKLEEKKYIEFIKKSNNLKRI